MGSVSSAPVRLISTKASGASALSSSTCPALVEFKGKLQDGVVAVFLAFAAQLLIAGIQHGLDQEKTDFPAPILAMAAVFLAFSIAGIILPGVEDFYRKRLKRAVSTLSIAPEIPADLGRRNS